MIPVARNLGSVDSAYERGLRSLMLTYNRMDHVGIGCMERVDGGLSMFGVDLVRHCNEIGVIVDVSHCGHLTTLDACRHSKRPVSANHTGAYALYDHPRGKTDEALRAIASTGGIVGIYAVPYFISPREHASIEQVLDHLDYVAGVVGWKHVGIGTDWPLQAPDSVLRATFGDPAHTQQFGASPGRFRRDVTQRTIGLEDIRDLPNITRGLVKRGYGDEEIRGILGGKTRFACSRRFAGDSRCHLISGPGTCTRRASARSSSACSSSLALRIMWTGTSSASSWSPSRTSSRSRTRCWGC
jgi:membrane dipeptidase